MMAVMPRPVKNPANTLPVILSRRERSLPPARRSSAWPIRFMPKRNRHSPPIIVSTLKISIFSIFPFFFFETLSITKIQFTREMSKLPEENCKIYVKYTTATEYGVICVMLHSFFPHELEKSADTKRSIRRGVCLRGKKQLEMSEESYEKRLYRHQ